MLLGSFASDGAVGLICALTSRLLRTLEDIVLCGCVVDAGFIERI